MSDVPRIEPRLPEPLEEIVARDVRNLRTSRTHYFEVAAAFMAGYRVREREDAAELGRLSEWAEHAERRLGVVMRFLNLDRPRRTS